MLRYALNDRISFSRNVCMQEFKAPGSARKPKAMNFAKPTACLFNQ